MLPVDLSWNKGASHSTVIPSWTAGVHDPFISFAQVVLFQALPYTAELWPEKGIICGDVEKFGKKTPKTKQNKTSNLYFTCRVAALMLIIFWKLNSADLVVQYLFLLKDFILILLIFVYLFIYLFIWLFVCFFFVLGFFCHFFFCFV